MLDAWYGRPSLAHTECSGLPRLSASPYKVVMKETNESKVKSRNEFRQNIDQQ